jgi:hypothetical protein
VTAGTTAPIVDRVEDVGQLPADGGAILDRVQTFLSRFVAYPSPEALTAAVLWVAHTHLVDSFESTPRLAHLSPEPGSGKTRALEVLELLVPRPLHAINATPAALFRKVSDEAGPPTILFDEIDTVFGPKAKDNEDIRGMLNAGHRRGATALRCVIRGKVIEVEEFPAYCAVALAGLGDLPDTIMTRSVVIKMRRRSATETVQPFRHRVHADEGHALGEAVAEWAATVADTIRHAWPEMPDGIEDRPADVWEPLLAVADAAGGDWPARGRQAAVALVAQAAERPATLGVKLLSDLRDIFDRLGVAALPTAQILSELCELELSPWSTLRGEPLTARGLAKFLRQYDVTSRVIRVGSSTPSGYRRSDLHDPWSRYLPAPPSGDNSSTSSTPQHRPADDSTADLWTVRLVDDPERFVA